MRVNDINAVLALIGLFLFAEGIWIAFSQRVIGIGLEGVAFGAIGTWNILLAFNDPSAKMPIFWGLIGIWQCILSWQKFNLYSRLAKIPIARSSTSEPLRMIDKREEEILAKANIIGRALVNAHRKYESDLIEFSIKPTFFNDDKRIWKGLLLSEFAVFADDSGEDLILANKDDVQLLNQRKFTNIEGLKLRQKLNVSFQICERKLGGIMSMEDMERFQSWKETAVRS